MKWLFFSVVLLACVLLGAAMVFIDGGVVSYFLISGLGALVAFLLAYQLQARFSILDED